MIELDAASSGLTSRLVMLALDGAMARHAAIAMNIANANVEGYRPVAARFDDLVEQLRGRALDGNADATTRDALSSVRTAMTSQPLVPDPNATQVQIDVEMAKLAQNTVQYQALLAAKSKATSIVRAAINEGRR